MILIIFFIGGLIIGSFLNVIIYRLRLVDTILGRSNCPHCKSQIRWYDNIPLLSFILLRAKCRDCEGKIAWQYPLVEFFTGIIFVLASRYFFNFIDLTSLWETGFYLVIFSLLIILLVYDWQYMEVPILIFWIALAVLLANFIFISFGEIRLGVDLHFLSVIQNLIGGFVAWLFFFCLVFFSKEKWMGWGDVYIGLLAGLILGWPNILLGLLLAFTIGAIYSIFIIILKRGNMKSQVPFIPFLVIGTFLAIFITREFPFVMDYILF
ncbi:MAG: prepilin peptidase [Parcubacteria group bacterium]|jgi:leader peptidase (prepilin peptidase)/N-methyltransferase